MPMFSDRKLRYQHGRGPCNIFILDTSSFLGKEGFIQMRTTFLPSLTVILTADIR